MHFPAEGRLAVIQLLIKTYQGGATGTMDVPVADQALNRIDRYQIVKTLGEGSFGKVKLAYHLATNTRVALKIINRRTLLKSDMQGRIEREIAYLRLLRHPHIIKLYEVIKSKDEIIMVLEYAGKELFDYIVQVGRMPENEARGFFQQIISAVSYCHRHKIVHRDLKPENLLLDENLNVKIADFGLSNIMTDGNFLKTSCGSPNYAAPEVISGRLYAGPEVDIWSCGVILYVLLCGRLPFDEESIPELFQKISAGTYTIPDYLSSGARSLMQKMLVVNPLERITDDEIIADPWFRVNLPRYLFPESKSVRQESLHFEEMDGIVKTLSQKSGYLARDVADALNYRQGEGKRSPANVSEIVDTYNLLEDQQRASKDQLDQYMASHGVASRPARRSRGNSDASLPNLGIETPPVAVAGSCIAVLPQSTTPYHLAYMEKSKGIMQTRRLTPQPNKKSKIRWYFGIRSRSYPLDVMGEIYRALKSLGAEWAVPRDLAEDLWTIHARWRGDIIPQKSGDPDFEQLKMRIQLYQLEQNNYVVDFKFDGFENQGGRNTEDTFSAYPFLRLATKLIMELFANSQ